MIHKRFSLQSVFRILMAVILASGMAGLSSRGATAAAPDSTADLVYGQAGSMGTNDPPYMGIDAGSLFFPTFLDRDAAGGLYVVVDGKNRVLYFPSGNTTATRVYGQGGSFTTRDANKGGISATSQFFSGTSSMAEGSLAPDSSGNLYVADTASNRVLYYPAGSTSAGIAEGVSIYSVQVSAKK